MVFKQSDAIEVRRVKGKGRGVFARRAIRAGEIIERVPVLVLAVDEVKNGEGWTGLAGFCFRWNAGTLALALGYGSLYNHSYQPNARYDDVGQQTKVYTALRDIAPGEEITINYNGDPQDHSDVGFEVIEPPGEEPSSTGERQRRTLILPEATGRATVARGGTAGC